MKNLSFILILFLSLFITSCTQKEIWVYKKVINLTDETIRLRFIAEKTNSLLPFGKDSVVYLELGTHQDMLLRYTHELTTYNGHNITTEKSDVNENANILLSQNPDSVYRYVFSHAYLLDTIYNSQNIPCKNHTWEIYPIGKNKGHTITRESVLKVRPEDFQ